MPKDFKISWRGGSLVKAASLIAAINGAAAQSTPPHLSRPAIDASIFREGEVNRTESRHGQWKVVCDEVLRLNQRYCSLEGLAKNIAGEVAARIVVSTSDNGRPAAMAFLPHSIYLPTGMRVTIDPPQQAQRGKAVAGTDIIVPVAQCDRRICIAGWALSPQEIGALNAGATIRLRYRLVKQLPPFLSSTMLPGLQTEIHSTLPTQGFSEAVAASIK